MLRFAVSVCSRSGLSWGWGPARRSFSSVRLRPVISLKSLFHLTIILPCIRYLHSIRKRLTFCIRVVTFLPRMRFFSEAYPPKLSLKLGIRVKFKCEIFCNFTFFYLSIISNVGFQVCCDDKFIIDIASFLMQSVLTNCQIIDSRRNKLYSSKRQFVFRQFNF